MSYYTGTNGSLVLAPITGVPNADGVIPGEKVIAKTKSWSFATNTQTIETTTLGDTDRTFQEGIRSGSGNAEIIYYVPQGSSQANVTDLLELAIGDRPIPGKSGVSPDEPEKFSMKFVIGQDGETVRYLYVRCAITQLQINHAVGEICTASFSFEFNGSPVKYRL